MRVHDGSARMHRNCSQPASPKCGLNTNVPATPALPGSNTALGWTAYLRRW
jgi:hypothetical protein